MAAFSCHEAATCAMWSHDPPLNTVLLALASHDSMAQWCYTSDFKAEGSGVQIPYIPHKIKKF